MGLRDLLKGRNVNLSDKEIVSDVMKDSKFELIGLAFALTECRNPELRMILLDQFNRCVIDHHALKDLAVKKDWSSADATPKEQIRIDLFETEKTIH